jgi:hypothetical protein
LVEADRLLAVVKLAVAGTLAVAGIFAAAGRQVAVVVIETVALRRQARMTEHFPLD